MLDRLGLARAWMKSVDLNFPLMGWEALKDIAIYAEFQPAIDYHLPYAMLDNVPTFLKSYGQYVYQVSIA